MVGVTTTISLWSIQLQPYPFPSLLLYSTYSLLLSPSLLYLQSPALLSPSLLYLQSPPLPIPSLPTVSCSPIPSLPTVSSPHPFSTYSLLLSPFPLCLQGLHLPFSKKERGINFLHSACSTSFCFPLRGT